MWAVGKGWLRMWVVGEGEGRFKLCLFGMSENFHKLPRIPKDMQARSNKNAPKAPKNKSGPPPGYERCWCHGFNISRGVVTWMACGNLNTNQRARMIEM